MPPDHDATWRDKTETDSGEPEQGRAGKVRLAPLACVECQIWFLASAQIGNARLQISRPGSGQGQSRRNDRTGP